MGVERLDVVRQFFVVPAVMFVSVRMLQEDAVKLLDVVFIERDFLPRIEHQFRGLRISGDFLFVASSERSQVEIREQGIDLPVRQPRAFDSSRSADGFDRRHTSQTRQAIGGQMAERLPRAFELVDLADKP